MRSTSGASSIKTDVFGFCQTLHALALPASTARSPAFVGSQTHTGQWTDHNPLACGKVAVRAGGE